MIDNTFDKICTRSCVTPESASQAGVSGIGPHLTPTSRKRKRSDGTVTNAFMQGKCYICKNGTKSKYTCSECSKERGSEYWICHSSTGRNCFVQHLYATHLSN